MVGTVSSKIYPWTLSSLRLLKRMIQMSSSFENSLTSYNLSYSTESLEGVLVLSVDVKRFYYLNSNNLVFFSETNFENVFINRMMVYFLSHVHWSNWTLLKTVLLKKTYTYIKDFVIEQFQHLSIYMKIFAMCLRYSLTSNRYSKYDFFPLEALKMIEILWEI